MQKHAIGAALTASVALLFSAAPAAAQMVSPTNPEAIKEVIEAKGWEATLNLPDDDNPYIQSSYHEMGFVVLFMNCDDNHRNCKTLQYYTGFSDAKETTLERINEWNMEKRFARSYRDAEGDPVIEMDIDLDFDGLPRQNVDESLNTWASLMDAFYEHIFPE